MPKKVFLLLIILILAGCAPQAETPTQTAESTPAPTPTEELFDPAAITGFLDDISSGRFGYIDQVLLIRSGQIVVDQALQHDYSTLNAGLDTPPGPYNYNDPNWHPYYQSGELHTLQSVTKSVTALILGIAIQQGDLPGPEGKILQFFPDYQIKELDKAKGDITLADLLTMRSGLFWDEWTYPVGDPRNSVTQMESSPDWIQFALDLPMQHDPGEIWAYNSGACQLLSAIISEATGLDIDAYAVQYLFGPLEIEDYYWKKTPGGLPDTEGGLYLKAEDLAKIGILVLNRGEWNGQQVVPRAWIEEMTSPQVPDVDPSDPYWNYGYGYLWWLLPGLAQGELEIIGALGYGGQFLLVVPDLDLVGVFFGWNIYGTSTGLIRDAFLERIVPAAR